MLSRSAALLLPLLALPLHSATLHVPTQFPTIQSAIDSATHGDEIVVATGTYTETLFIQGKDIYLHSLDPTSPSVVEATILDASLEDSVVTFAGTETSDCILAGFTIQNGSEGYGGGINGHKCHATIRNNLIQDNFSLIYGGGLYQCNGIIEHNEITDNQSNAGGGLCDCDGQIQFNRITFNTADDSYVPFSYQGRGGGLADCGGTILGNIVSRNYSDGPGGGAQNVGDLAYNTFYRNSGDSGMAASKTGSLYGNIFWEPYGDPLGDTPDPKYCILSFLPLLGEVNGNLGTDPRMVDPDNMDFHLQPDSPAIDAGTSLFGPDFDLEDNPRPYDATDRTRGDGTDFDIGAFEYIGEAQPNPLPHQPYNVSPEDGETVFGFNPLMVSSPFIDDDTADFHTKTEWQVDDVPNINPNNLVVGWLSDAPDLIELTVLDQGQTLPPGKTFWWRIRHRDNYAGWSEWSVATSFITRTSGTIHVPQDVPTIQGALDVSTPGDVILISPGTYNESLVIRTEDVTLRSLDPKDATTVASTIIQGPQYPEITINIRVDGFVLSGLSIGGSKEGVQCDYKRRLLFEDCAFTSGKIAELGDDGKIVNCKITMEGGLENCNGLIQGCEITNGKGIYSSFIVPSRIDVIENVIRDNSSTGIARTSGIISGNHISQNKGGGIRSSDGPIMNNFITDNTSRFGSGLLDCGGDIVANTIVNNTATLTGGALSGCDGLIMNNVILDNNAPEGGAALIGCDGLIVANTIFRNNSAQRSGGLVSCSGTIRNNIIWDNLGETDQQLFECSVPSYCCIQFWNESGEGNIPADPVFLDSINGNLHLQEDSPCIDAGGYLSNVVSDYWGDPRPLDGTSEERGDGSNFDIGADEFFGKGLFNLATDIDGSGWVDVIDLLEIVNNWHTVSNKRGKSDLNDDTMIDSTDLKILLSDWYRGTGP